MATAKHEGELEGGRVGGRESQREVGERKHGREKYDGGGEERREGNKKRRVGMREQTDREGE